MIKIIITTLTATLLLNAANGNIRGGLTNPITEKAEQEKSTDKFDSKVIVLGKLSAPTADTDITLISASDKTTKFITGTHNIKDKIGVFFSYKGFEDEIKALHENQEIKRFELKMLIDEDITTEEETFYRYELVNILSLTKKDKQYIDTVLKN